jgi:predicted dehydrogenase
VRPGAVTLRLGVIGTGFARRVQLPALAHVPGVLPTAVASGNRANAEATARLFRIPAVYDDGAELAADPQVDAVIVASTPATHARFAIAALEAGKHVLCEKPTALDTVEAQRMLAASRAHPRQVAWIDHELRYEANRRKVRDLIRAGAIGEVRHLELSLKPYLRTDGRAQTNQSATPWTWWSDAAQGGGILGAVGSHLVDLCRFWTGHEVTQVGGGVATFVRERTDAAGVVRPVTSEELGSFVMLHAGGEVATLTLSSVAHHGPGHLAQITGSEGTLSLTGEAGLQIGKTGGALEDVTAADDLKGRTKPDTMWARGFVGLMRDFVRACGGAAPEGDPATFHDGWIIQRVLDAVRRGAVTRLD